MVSIYGLLGAFIGFIIFRSVWGAFLGYFLGSIFQGFGKQVSGGAQGQQKAYSNQYQAYGRQTGSFYGQNPQAQFSRSLLILSAEVMKADGKVLKVELDFVKNFLVNQFSEQQAIIYLRDLKELLNTNVNLQQTCLDLNSFMPLQQRAILVQYLFGIAQSDGRVSDLEFKVIERIAVMLRIPTNEFEQLKSMFWKDAGNAYKVLGLDNTASDEDIKKAYRKMAVAHHPDKYATMGEEHQKAAKEKFQKIQEAYEIVKKERGL
jgi:DnaJ like chaperone protein